MNLEHFSSQLKEMGACVADMRRGNGGFGSIPTSWEETSTALDTAMEELRVAEEELLQQASEIELSWQVVKVERQRYQDLFEFAPDGFLVTNLFGMIREANRAAAGLLGVSPEFLAGKPLANYVEIAQRRSFRTGLSRLSNVRQAADFVEAARLHRECREAEQRKDDFLAVQSNELRRPLAAILDAAQALRPGETAGEDLEQARGVLIEQAQHMSRLVDGLLGSSRFRRRAIGSRHEPIELREVGPEAKRRRNRASTRGTITS